MIPVSVMVAGEGTVSFRIKGRYGKHRPSSFAGPLRPIVVWNITWRCNLRCKHCYIDAMPKARLRELGTEQMLGIVDQVAEIRSPLLIVSGGEPLLREDFYSIMKYAAGKGLRLALSTNGTLITEEVAEKLRETGFVYIGVSIDSHEPRWHDEFRGVKGAFNAAIQGLRNAMNAGIPVGLRTVITRFNATHVPQVVELAVRLGVPRIALYHLEPIGRGAGLSSWLPSPEQYAWLMDRLIELARRYAGVIEIETVTAPFDGIYIADKVAGSREDFYRLLEVVKAQGGCGRKIVSIYPDGEVHPCQFIPSISLGNAARSRLSTILREDNPLLRPFIYTHAYLRGPRCSKCPFKEYCQGGSRMRAWAATGDLFGDDPYCSLPVERIADKWGVR
jgi:radical SAM protein with 4Fe4S-binding SPASM domain